MVNSRDIGLRGVGAGKGDASRTKLTKEYLDNHMALGLTRDTWGGPIMETCHDFKKVAPGRYRKVFK